MKKQYTIKDVDGRRAHVRSHRGSEVLTYDQIVADVATERDLGNEVIIAMEAVQALDGLRQRLQRLGARVIWASVQHLQ